MKGAPSLVQCDNSQYRRTLDTIEDSLAFLDIAEEGADTVERLAVKLERLNTVLAQTALVHGRVQNRLKELQGASSRASKESLLCH
jgi:hypothetical protein